MKPQPQRRGKPRKIVGFHLDERLDWVADLECGHQQYVRHNPPWTDRHWITTFEGRIAHIGQELNCLSCPETEDLRRARVRQLFDVFPGEHTEIAVLKFHQWLKQHNPGLLSKEPGDSFRHLKSDLEGMFKR